MRYALWVAALVLGLQGAVLADLPRQLPADGKLGTLSGGQPYPILRIGDKDLRLAPGGRIIDRNNRIILHAYLPEEAEVLYVVDMHGDVSRVWLLRPDEVEQLKRRK